MCPPSAPGRNRGSWVAAAILEPQFPGRMQRAHHSPREGEEIPLLRLVYRWPCDPARRVGGNQGTGGQNPGAEPGRPGRTGSYGVPCPAQGPPRGAGGAPGAGSRGDESNAPGKPVRALGHWGRPIFSSTTLPWTIIWISGLGIPRMLNSWEPIKFPPLLTDSITVFCEPFGITVTKPLRLGSGTQSPPLAENVGL